DRQVCELMRRDVPAHIGSVCLQNRRSRSDRHLCRHVSYLELCVYGLDVIGAQIHAIRLLLRKALRRNGQLVRSRQKRWKPIDTARVGRLRVADSCLCLDRRNLGATKGRPGGIRHISGDRAIQYLRLGHRRPRNRQQRQHENRQPAPQPLPSPPPSSCFDNTHLRLLHEKQPLRPFQVFRTTHDLSSRSFLCVPNYRMSRKRLSRAFRPECLFDVKKSSFSEGFWPFISICEQALPPPPGALPACFPGRKSNLWNPRIMSEYAQRRFGKLHPGYPLIRRRDRSHGLALSLPPAPRP